MRREERDRCGAGCETASRGLDACDGSATTTRGVGAALLLHRSLAGVDALLPGLVGDRREHARFFSCARWRTTASTACAKRANVMNRLALPEQPKHTQLSTNSDTGSQDSGLLDRGATQALRTPLAAGRVPTPPARANTRRYVCSTSADIARQCQNRR